MSDNGPFQFVNVSKPSQSQNAAVRKLIRRNATLHRHRKHQASQVADAELENDRDEHSVRLGLRLQLLPVEMDQFMYDLLNYTDKVMGPGLFPLKSLYQYHPGHQMMMCLALQDPKVLSSAVALASLQYAWQNNAHSIIVTGLKHQGHALGLMKASLAKGESGVDPGTALCVMNLASSELAFKNEIGWQTHMDCLARILEHPDAPSSLGLVQFSVIDVEVLGCYMFDKQPTLICDKDLPQNTLQSSYLTTLDVLKKREALQRLRINLDKTLALDETLVDLLIEMQILTNVVGQTDHFACPELLVRSFVSARISIEYRLLRVRSQAGLSQFSLAVCLAAQIYVNRVLRTFEQGSTVPHRIAERTKSAIVSALEEVPPGAKFPVPMLWVAFLGGVGAREGPLRQWFVEFIHQICSCTNLTLWDEVRLLLDLCPWSEELLAEECKMLWEDADEGGRSDLGLADPEMCFASRNVAY